MPQAKVCLPKSVLIMGIRQKRWQLDVLGRAAYHQVAFSYRVNQYGTSSYSPQYIRKRIPYLRLYKCKLFVSCVKMRSALTEGRTDLLDFGATAECGAGLTSCQTQAVVISAHQPSR